MEESREVQCEENKAAPEKNKAGRQFKSPEQLQGLENFYNEHKYPTESMKAEMAVKLNLTDKQVSGWFCHRRLKDKRALLEEEPQHSQAPQRPDLSSGVIQDRASGLKQDSCSSTKQADHKRADLREVESWRYHHENIPAEEQRSLGDGNEMDDTSSESNSALQESFYPQISRSLPVETTEFHASNGFIQPSKGRAGPSGYLKIKGLTENAAITAVKRQLGRHYREDGPSLGIEFDPLPPEAFESLSRNINEDFYGVPEHDISGAGSHKHPRLSMMRNEMQHEAPANMYLHKSDPNNFSFHQPKQKFPFPNQYRTFPDPKSSFGIDSRPARDNSDYSSSRNLSEGCKNDLVSIRSDSRLDHPLQAYGGKVRNPKNTLPVYGNVVPKVVRQKEQLFSRPAALADRHNDLMYKEDRLPPFNRDEEVDVGRRHTSEHNDLVKLKMRPANELRANKRGREEVLEEDYAISTSSQDPALWSKQMKGPMEMPSSFSEDETAETSSSMEQGL